MEIRAVTYADIPELSDIYTRVYEAFDVGERWNVDAASRLLKHYLGRRPDLAFVSHHDEKLLGAILFDVKPWWDGNRLNEGEIFVDPSRQRSGIGTALLTKALTEAVERYDVSTWEATTFANVEFPLSWYRNLGFEQISGLTLITGNVAAILQQLHAQH